MGIDVDAANSVLGMRVSVSIQMLSMQSPFPQMLPPFRPHVSIVVCPLDYSLISGMELRLWVVLIMQLPDICSNDLLPSILGHMVDCKSETALDHLFSHGLTKARWIGRDLDIKPIMRSGRILYVQDNLTDDPSLIEMLAKLAGHGRESPDV